MAGKKPNTFIKGMASDLDSHAIPSENYQEAINARLVSRSNDLFSIKNIPGMKELPPIGTGGEKIIQKGNFYKSAIGSLNPRYISQIKIIITYSDNSTSTGTFDVQTHRTLDTNRLGPLASAYQVIEYTNNQYMGMLFQAAKNTSIETYYDVTLKVPSSSFDGNNSELIFIPKNLEKSIKLTVLKYTCGVEVTENNKLTDDQIYFKTASGYTQTTEGQITSSSNLVGEGGYFGKVVFTAGGSGHNGSITSPTLGLVVGFTYRITVFLEGMTGDAAEDKLELYLNNNSTADATISANGLTVIDVLCGSGTTDTLKLKAAGNNSAGQTFDLRYLQIQEIGATDLALTNDDFDRLDFVNNYNIVGLTSFSDYLCALGHSSNDKDGIFKLEFDTTGSMTKQTPLILGDLGFSDTTSIRLEKIEENDKFQRIYFTDGVNPVRGLNILGDSFYYAGLSEEGLNLVINAALRTPVVSSVSDGGNLRCGSYSYCYRLMTADGKFSSISPISNPTPVYKSSKTKANSSMVLGGRLNESSGKFIQITVSNIDQTYDRIQLIALQYVSEQGAIIPTVITDTKIYDAVISLAHTGNEITEQLTLHEILVNRNTWDSCKDLAIKDNRLFASNLSNTSTELNIDKNTFRVQSYRADSDNVAYTAVTYPNPDLLKEDLYFFGDTATPANNRARYIKPYSANGSDAITTGHVSFPKFIGAETADFGANSSVNGVRVTFKMKQFTLDENVNSYYRALTDDGNYSTPPFYGIDNKLADDSFYDNYKNPIFSQKYKGYMRGEIYRFGIQFYDKQGESTFVYPIGDVRMPDINTPYQEIRIDSDGSSRVYSNTGNCVFGGNNSAVDQDSSLPLRYITADENGKGYILYPEFRVKLSNDVKKRISGYSIVRVERDAANSSVQLSGAASEVIKYKNEASSGSLSNILGNTLCPLVSAHFDNDTLSGQPTGTWDADQVHTRLHTIDSPDIIFGTNKYVFNSNDQIKVCGVLNAFHEDSPPVTTTKKIIQDNGTSTKYYGGRYIISGTGTNHETTRKYTFYSRYYLDGGLTEKATDLTTASRYSSDSTGNTYSVYQSLNFTEVVGPNSLVSASKLNVGFNYRNQALTGDFNQIALGKKEESSGSAGSIDDAGFVLDSYSRRGNGNTILLANISSGLDGIQAQAFGANHADFQTVGNYWHAQKLLVKIYRRLDVVTLYGGNTVEAFDSNRYISTGTDEFDLGAVEKQTIAASGGDVYLSECFGGDTFVCMYGVSKHNNSSLNETKSYNYGQAIVFPVESRINLDFRQGDFFGAPILSASASRTEQRSREIYDSSTGNTTIEYFDVTLTDTSGGGLARQTEDDYIYNPTYSTQNSTRGYLPQPTDFVEVNDFKNVIAASNLKLSGDKVDAFARFDANEFFEVDMAQGAIHNIFNFKNELFVLQANGVGFLSVNSRALIPAEGGVIQVAAGSGNVIQRIDYLNTKYGSQHFNNGVVTSSGLYWFDDNQSAFCMLQFTGKGASVSNILETTYNSNLLFDLRNKQINDNPLLVGEILSDQIGTKFITKNQKTSKVGGVHLYNDELYGEVGLCITGMNTTPNFINIVYDESLAAVTSKRTYKTLLSSLFNGRLYSIGYQGTSGNLSRSNLFLHDEGTVYNNFYDRQADENFKVKFVCNEDVFLTKVFDKVVLYLTGNQNSAKITKFTFTDSLGNTETLTDLTHAKMKMGKHIVPIRSKVSTARLKGDFITIEAEYSGTTEEIEIFSALIHYRTMQL